MRNKIILPLALAAAALLLLVIAGVSAQGTLLPTARGGSLASHQDGRGASVARRDDREYREYLSEEQRSRRGCIARRMQLGFHHGLLGRAASANGDAPRRGRLELAGHGAP